MAFVNYHPGYVDYVCRWRRPRSAVYVEDMEPRHVPLVHPRIQGSMSRSAPRVPTALVAHEVGILGDDDLAANVLDCPGVGVLVTVTWQGQSAPVNH